MDKFERDHAKYVALMQKRMQDILDSYEREITRLAGAVTTDPDRPFRFADHPALKARYEKLIKDMEAELQQAVESGVKNEWGRADRKNDALAIGVVGSAEKAASRGCLRRNENALTAFLGRKAAGMTLSDRVWQYTNQYDAQIQAAIDVALIDGKSAAELSRDVRSYLVHPDTLFRRVRDERGVIHLSKNAKAFHPGQGVYRSAYMNARRMAATEINMAYRTSDYMRIQQMDFVVGIEVHLSGNHNCKGIPPGQFFDICDELQGKYPKTFKFTGWHPHCRCYTTTILKSREEMKEDAKRIKEGEPPTKAQDSPNAVKELPDNFTKWLDDNQQRVATAKRLPYFLKDNGHMEGDVWVPFQKVLPPAKPTLLDLAAQRHAARTPEQVQKIKEAWAKTKQEHDLIRKTADDVLKEAGDYGEIDFSELKAAIDSGNLDRMETAASKVEQIVSEVNRQEGLISDLIPNAHNLHKTYSMDELKEAYWDIDSVMKKWLAKYNYTSLDASDLKHLRNKLEFELTNPSIGYSNKDIVKEAITAKIKLIDRKIEWNDMVSKAATLKSFKTRSTIYKDWLAKIDDAIQNDDFNGLQKSIAEAENQQQKLVNKQIKRGGDIKSALNKEYKGGAIGKDITSTVDTSNMVSEDPYGDTFTNNVARMQGFDAPAKLVTEQEFALLEKACGEVFYRTVNPTKFNGINMSSSQFAAQLYEADLLELNGPGGRAYGDGMYVATSAWNGSKINPLTDNAKRIAYRSSICYGRGNHTISEMTFTRKPKIITQRELWDKWSKLTPEQKQKFGGRYSENTFACALGYDAMYCDGPNYMVIWNRSIIAVKSK